MAEPLESNTHACVCMRLNKQVGSLVLMWFEDFRGRFLPPTYTDEDGRAEIQRNTSMAYLQEIIIKVFVATSKL